MKASEIEINAAVKYQGKNWSINGHDDSGSICLMTEYPHAEEYALVDKETELELGAYTFEERVENRLAAHAERMEALRCPR